MYAPRYTIIVSWSKKSMIRLAIQIIFFVNKQLILCIKNCSNSNDHLIYVDCLTFRKIEGKKDLHQLNSSFTKKMFVCILTFYILCIFRESNMTFIYHSKTTGRFYLWHWICLRNNFNHHSWIILIKKLFFKSYLDPVCMM